MFSWMELPLVKNYSKFWEEGKNVHYEELWRRPENGWEMKIRYLSKINIISKNDSLSQLSKTKFYLTPILPHQLFF